MASDMYMDVKNTNTYACNNPSNKSKYKLKTAGKNTGTTILISSMMTNAPRTLPKRRIHKDKGLVNTSKMLMGVTIATGSVK